MEKFFLKTSVTVNILQHFTQGTYWVIQNACPYLPYICTEEMDMLFALNKNIYHSLSQVYPSFHTFE